MLIKQKKSAVAAVLRSRFV